MLLRRASEGGRSKDNKYSTQPCEAMTDAMTTGSQKSHFFVFMEKFCVINSSIIVQEFRCPCLALNTDQVEH